MTYIEFFDKTATENISACLTQKPERVVLVGRDRKQMEKSVEHYKSVLTKRGQNTEFIVRTVNSNNLTNTVSVLEDIIEKNGHCVFDLTGGDDLYLVGAGIVFEKLSGKNVELIRFSVASGTVYDCDGNGKPELSPLPALTVEENVAIYGGRVTWGGTNTVRWEVDGELFKDVENMWSICKKDVKRWNNLINTLEATHKVTKEPEGLEASADVSVLSTYTERLITRSTFDFEFLDELCEKGLITFYEFKNNRFKLKYKNNGVKRCLTKAGQVLEMKVYLSMLKATNDDGTLAYNDALTGVSIDWDGKTTGIDTANEIDVLAMAGLIPVFVSCKNGFVEMDELYKLNTVAERFGGRYAKKVLIASALDIEGSFGKILKARADDMGIRVIASEITALPDEELNRKIRSFGK